MSEVLDFLRSRYPGLAKEDDETLTEFAGDKHPELLKRDPEFAKDYQAIIHNRTGFKDLSASESLRISPTVGRVAPPERATTFGGPRKPVASAAETLVEPIEQVGEVAREKGVPLTQFVPEVKPEDSRTMAVGKTVLKLAASIPEFATSNVGLGAAAAGAVAPVITAGAFTADMLYSLGKQVLDAHKNWDQMTPAQHYAAVTDMVGTGALATLTGAHATRGVLNKVVPARAAADMLNKSEFTPKATPVSPIVRAAVPDNPTRERTSKCQHNPKPRERTST